MKVAPLDVIESDNFDYANGLGNGIQFEDPNQAV